MVKNLVRAAGRSRGEADESLPSLLLKGLRRAVRDLRRRREMTRKARADARGLSERFLSALESGRSNISVAKLVGLAQALGVRPVDLLAGKAEGEVGSQVIALLGLRGAGKTSVGQALAERLVLPFYELHRLVEPEAGLQLS